MTTLLHAQPPVVEQAVPAAPALRVAVVTETYPPEVNGVAATIARVVHGLQARGHSVQLLRPRQAADEVAHHDGQLSEVLLPGLPIPRYPQLKMGLPSGAALRRLWQQQRPDVVHIVTEGPLGWSALQVARQLQLPVVSDFRTNFHAYSEHYGVGWLRRPVMAYLRHFHNRTACTMVPTQALRSELAAAGLHSLRVVARGVDTRLFDPARRSATLRASWGAGPDTTVALCVGRLAPEKNLGLVVDTYEAMRDADPQLRLVLVGDGPEKTRLMQRCRGAVFAGVQRGTDLAAHYASADIFLFASTTETYGNVVPEAMASGLAVVAYNHAAAGALLRHGENGLLAPLGDPGMFSRMAVRLAADPAQAHALGVQARITAGHHDWAQIAAMVENEYAGAMLSAGGLAGTVRGR